MSSSESVRVAIIGYGLAGSVFHAPLVDSVDGMEVAAIVTSNPERIDAAKQAYPECRILSSVDEVWNSADDLDLVVVASPNKFHFPHCKAALEAGLAVVVDKPMAVRSEECRELIELAASKKLPFSVFQNRRWDGDFLTVRKLVEDGRLSGVFRIESRFERFRPEAIKRWRESGAPEEAGGLLYDLGSHLIDQACVLFGDPISVHAELNVRRTNAEAVDDVFLSLSFQNDVTAHLWCSAIAGIQGPRFRVLGLNGAYEKYGLDPQEDQLKAGLRPGDTNWGLDKTGSDGSLVSTTSDTSVETLPGSYELYYKQMRDAVRGLSPVPVPPEAGLRTIEIIETAKIGCQALEP